MLLKAYGNRDEMPSVWEQEVAEAYVNYRQLYRPNTSVKIAVIAFLLFVSVTIALVWFVYFIFFDIGVITRLPDAIQEFYNISPILFGFLLCAIVTGIELLICGKYALIGIIELYQHYAPEEIRRRCLFMPTCSEYTIFAVRKYGVIVGLCKSYFRLVYRCRGNIYMIDYP